MRRMRRLFRRIDCLLRRTNDGQRLNVEIEEHLALQTADNLRAGYSPEEARRRALLKFGAIESTREAWREERSLPAVETLFRDTRLALRHLRDAPAFALTIILTLAIGIGATTSIFTLIYAVLMKSLLVVRPEELLRLGKDPRCCYFGGYTQPDEFSLVSYDLYRHFRDHADGFSELAAFQAGGTLLGVRRTGRSDMAQSYPGEFVSGNYFRTFGVNAHLGRLLTPEDDQPNATPVAVMSYRLWQDRYGSDPSVVGAVFDLNQKPFTLIGVAPPGFFGDTLRNQPPDLFLSLNTEPYVQPDGDLYKYDMHWLELIGRMRARTTPAAVQAPMRVALKQWLRSHWGEMSPEERAAFPQQTLYVGPGGAGITVMRRDYEHWLKVLMTVTVVVLLIACANIANLMLVRTLEQRRQISLSMALGAPPSRLIRQKLTETTLFSLLGGAAGLALAYAGTGLLLRFTFPANNGALVIPISASPSLPVLAFASIVSLFTGIAFGLVPAWMTIHTDPIEALRGSNRSTRRTASVPSKTLVILQTAFSLVLLCAAGLLTTTLQHLENQNLGFQNEHRIVVNINARLGGYRPDQLTALNHRIRDTLAVIPGVAGVALCTYSPLSDNAWGAGVWVVGRPDSHLDNSAAWTRVTPGYFDVLDMHILKGRAFNEHDTAKSRVVAVINEALARKFFPNEDALGRFFRSSNAPGAPAYEIVGVVEDTRYLSFGIAEPITPFFFRPDAQRDFAPAQSEEMWSGSHYLNDIVLLVQSGANVNQTAIRRAVASVDPNLPVVGIRTLRDQVSAVFRNQRLLARLTSFFGLLSLLLASIGLYGVTAYNVAQRTSEIGVRAALGATRAQILTLVLRGALTLIGIGLMVGLPLSLAAGRLLRSQLYGTNPYHTLVIATSMGALTFSALIAALLPALRASSLSPLNALRTE